MKQANKSALEEAVQTYLDTPPTFFTPKQLAARWQCSLMKLRRMRRAGTLSVHYIGRSARYPSEAVLRIETESKA